MRAVAGNVEVDRVEAGQRVSVENRLTERARAGVGGVNDREDRGRQSGNRAEKQKRRKPTQIFHISLSSREGF